MQANMYAGLLVEGSTQIRWFHVRSEDELEEIQLTNFQEWRRILHIPVKVEVDLYKIVDLQPEGKIENRNISRAEKKAKQARARARARDIAYREEVEAALKRAKKARKKSLRDALFHSPLRAAPVSTQVLSARVLSEKTSFSSPDSKMTLVNSKIELDTNPSENFTSQDAEEGRRHAEGRETLPQDSSEEGSSRTCSGPP